MHDIAMKYWQCSALDGSAWSALSSSCILWRVWSRRRRVPWKKPKEKILYVYIPFSQIGHNKRNCFPFVQSEILSSSGRSKENTLSTKYKAFIFVKIKEKHSFNFYDWILWRTLYPQLINCANVKIAFRKGIVICSSRPISQYMLTWEHSATPWSHWRMRSACVHQESNGTFSSLFSLCCYCSACRADWCSKFNLEKIVLSLKTF